MEKGRSQRLRNSMRLAFVFLWGRPIGKQLTSDDNCGGTANRSWCCRSSKRQRQHQSKANSRSAYRSTDCRSTDCRNTCRSTGCHRRHGNDRCYLRNVRLRELGDLREHDRRHRDRRASPYRHRLGLYGRLGLRRHGLCYLDLVVNYDRIGVKFMA